MGQVVVEQLEGHGLEGLGGGGDLLEDVDAVPVLVDHALQAPDLAFDPAQALLDGVLVVDVARSHRLLRSSTGYPYRVSGGTDVRPAPRTGGGSAHGLGHAAHPFSPGHVGRDRGRACIRVTSGQIGHGASGS